MICVLALISKLCNAILNLLTITFAQVFLALSLKPVKRKNEYGKTDINPKNCLRNLNQNTSSTK